MRSKSRQGAHRPKSICGRARRSRLRCWPCSGISSSLGKSNDYPGIRLTDGRPLCPLSAEGTEGVLRRRRRAHAKQRLGAREVARGLESVKRTFRGQRSRRRYAAILARLTSTRRHNIDPQILLTQWLRISDLPYWLPASGKPSRNSAWPTCKVKLRSVEPTCRSRTRNQPSC